MLNAFTTNAKRIYNVHAVLNAFTRGVTHVYYKRKTRLLAMLNAFAGNAFCETNRDSTRSSRAKGVAHLRDVHMLEFCARRPVRHILGVIDCTYITCIADMTQGCGLNRHQAELTYQRANLTL